MSASFDGAVTALIGYDISATATVGSNANFVIDITTPSVHQHAVLVAQGMILHILYFDLAAQTYTALPPESFFIDPATSRVTFIATLAGRYFLSYRASLVTVNLNVPVLVAARSNQTFSLGEGSYNNTVRIENLDCEAGSVTFSESVNATIELNAVAKGKSVVSKVYTFSHSAGENAVHSARLVFDTTQSDVFKLATKIENTTLAWYTYISSAWQVQGGSVQGSLVVYDTTHFSDWSVQASATGGQSNGAASLRGIGAVSWSYGFMNLLMALVLAVLAYIA